MAFMLQGSNSDVAAQGRISRRSLLGIAVVFGRCAEENGKGLDTIRHHYFTA